MFIPAQFAAVSYDTVSGVVESVTTEFSISALGTLIAGIVGASIVFVGFWWALRFATKRIMGAVKRGKLRV